MLTKMHVKLDKCVAGYAQMLGTGDVRSGIVQGANLIVDKDEVGCCAWNRPTGERQAEKKACCQLASGVTTCCNLGWKVNLNKALALQASSRAKSSRLTIIILLLLLYKDEVSPLQRESPDGGIDFNESRKKALMSVTGARVYTVM